MKNNIETVEDVKVEETGEQTNVATETKAEVKMITLEEAQKMVDGALAKKLPPKEKMDAFRKWEESQKTEADKQAEKEKQDQEKDTKITELQKENTVLKKRIYGDDVDYVMFKVGKMDGDFADNLETFLKENPKYLAKEETKKPETTGIKTTGVESKESGVTSILKAKYPERFE